MQFLSHGRGDKVCLCHHCCIAEIASNITISDMCYSYITALEIVIDNSKILRRVQWSQSPVTHSMPQHLSIHTTNPESLQISSLNGWGCLKVILHRRACVLCILSSVITSFFCSNKCRQTHNSRDQMFQAAAIDQIQ